MTQANGTTIRSSPHDGPVEEALAVAALPPSRLGSRRSERLTQAERQFYFTILREFAAGSRTALLSNDLSAFHRPEWVAGVAAFRHLGPLLDAASLGARKPEPAAYAAALDRLGVAPGEVVFVDDLEENVHGAEAAGLRGVLFDIADPAGSIRRVRRALLAGSVRP